MRRRSFIQGISGFAAAWPLSARAQSLPMIGWLGSQNAEQFSGRVRAFLQGLKESGYDEGRNFAIQYSYADGNVDRLPALAADMVRRRVAVIAAIGSVRCALAAKAATTEIPIVFQSGIDPVEAGLVASLSHPGGNLTGISNLNVELLPKRLELLHLSIPSASVIGLIVNPTNPAVAEANTRELEVAARSFGLRLQVQDASTEGDFETAFANLAQQGAGGLVIGGDAFFTSKSAQLAALALRYALPTVYQFREFAAAGGLISYGGSLTEANRLTGVYAARILKGEKPADLPVQQTTKVEMFINLNTAKTLGVNVPLSILGRADEAIE
jgi:putative ABC transport system substrate-binding protein